MTDARPEVRREATTGIASVCRMVEPRETREDARPSQASVADNLFGDSTAEQSNQNNAESRGENSLNDRNTQPTHAASSASC